MSLVFLKIPRLPFSFRLVKNWVSAGFFWLTSQLLLSNPLLQLRSTLESFLLEPPLQVSTHLKLIILPRTEPPFQVFNSSSFFFLIEPPFRVFNSSFFHFLFFFFISFFSFHHTFKNSKFAQNGWKIQKDKLVKNLFDF